MVKPQGWYQLSVYCYQVEAVKGNKLTYITIIINYFNFFPLTIKVILCLQNLSSITLFSSSSPTNNLQIVFFYNIKQYIIVNVFLYFLDRHFYLGPKTIKKNGPYCLFFYITFKTKCYTIGIYFKFLTYPQKLFMDLGV